MQKILSLILALPERLRTLAHRRRVRLTAYYLAGFLVLLGVLGFFAAPPLLKNLLQEKAAEALHRPVSIERVEVNPYALSVTLHGLSVKAKEGHEFIGFDSLKLNLSSFSLFHRGLVVDEIVLQKPRVHVTRLADGRYDISDLLDGWLKPSDSPTPRFSLNNIQVSGGHLEFDDRPVGKKHVVAELDFKLPFVSSLPYQAEVLVEPSFAAAFNGAQVILQGKSKPFAGSHESELNLNLKHIDLAGFQPYLPANIPLRLTAGVLDSELKILFRRQPAQASTLSLAGAVHLAKVNVSDVANQPLLAWQQADIDISSADLLNRQIRLGQMHLAGLETHLTVNRQGELNWLRLAKKFAAPAATPAVAAQPAAQPAAAANALDLSLAKLRLSGGMVHWRDESNGKPLQAEVRDLNALLTNLSNNPRQAIELAEVSLAIDAGEALQLNRLELKGGRLDLLAHRMELAEFNIKGGTAKVLRNAAGQIEWLAAPRLASMAGSSPAAAKGSGEEKAWQLALNKFEIDGVSGRFEDRSLAPVAVQTLDTFTLTAEKFETGPGRQSPLSIRATMNGKGSLKVDGRVQLQPLQTELKIDAASLPLLLLQPYFSDRLNVTVTRGNFSVKGDLGLQTAADGLAGGFKGQVNLGNFYAVDQINSADFLRWKSLYLGGMDIRLQPLAVNIGEVALTDFFSRLIISPAGKLNLLEIVKQPPVGAVKTESGAAVAASEPATVAPAAAIPVRIGKVSLQGGAINFSDRFVKPSYTVNLTKVGGRISGLSSAAETVADMELRAAYANNAPVQILAKLNPLAAKAFLDLNAEVRGIDLVTLSPYSGKYAGYNIEKGKLSLFVSYKLKDNKLEAENRVFLDQLTFGEKVDSPDATSLPVNLALALLKNGRGEIDVNLPIAGSLDDPQFSLGGVVLKVIVNLFVKAVSSPFALLGSMFGGGEELSFLEFDAGRSALPGAASKRLETLSKALQDRPALKLEITGRVDPEIDREGLKRVALDRAVRVEKQKELLAKGQETGSLRDVVVDASEYPRYLQRAYREAKFPKPRNLLGLQKDLPVDEMEKLMLSNLTTGEDEMRQLAVRRAEIVQVWLSEKGKIAHERLFIMAPKIKPDEKNANKNNRVDFSLR